MRLKNYIHQEPDIRTYQGGEGVDNSCLVGIEVELEKYSDVGNHVYWRAEHDGSLREGGVEFVLRQPLTGLDLEKSIKELYADVLSKEYATSPRTSTHVHIDARDMSVEHLRAMVFIYTMFERMIYDKVAPEREDSFYCTPLYNSVKHRRIFSKALEQLEFTACPKYSGLNLKSLVRYGSVEFRMYEGLTNSKDLTKWVKMLMRLKSGTKQYENVPLADVLKMYSENTAESIIRAVFGDMAEDLLKDGEYNSRLKSSMRSAQDLLLLTQPQLALKERKWWSEYCNKGAQGIDGIPDDVLEVLRERRDELFN